MKLPVGDLVLLELGLCCENARMSRTKFFATASGNSKGLLRGQRQHCESRNHLACWRRFVGPGPHGLACRAPASQPQPPGRAPCFDGLGTNHTAADWMAVPANPTPGTLDGLARSGSEPEWSVMWRTLILGTLFTAVLVNP